MVHGKMNMGLIEMEMLGISNGIINGLYNEGDLAGKGNLHLNCRINVL